MPIIYQAENGLWLKKALPSEQNIKHQVKLSLDHIRNKSNPHTASDIVASSDEPTKLDSVLIEIVKQLSAVKLMARQTAANNSTLSEAVKKMEVMERELFYYQLQRKNREFKILEYDLFRDSSLLEVGEPIFGALCAPLDASPVTEFIFRTKRISPENEGKSFSAYMVHVDYVPSDDGDIKIDISFDGGMNFIQILNSSPDCQTQYYKKPIDFTMTRQQIPKEIEAKNFVLRFRLTTGQSGTAPRIKGYGILLS